MGKGNRVRVERADERKAKKEAAARAAAKAKLLHNILVCVSIILIAAIFVGVAYVAFIKGPVADKKLHGSTAIKSDNYEINGAQMSYFFNASYMNLLNTYSSYLSYLGLDTSKDLKSQACSYGSDGDTWYDYLADSAEKSAKQVLVLCEEAKTRGITLDDSDKATVESGISDLKTAAGKQNLSLDKYISKYYGKYVTESDVRASLEMSTLASKVHNTIYDEFKYTDEQLAKQCADNLSKYYKSDYKSIAIAADASDDDDAVKAANLESKAQADKFAALTDADAFDKAAEEYYRSKFTVVADDDEHAKDDGYLTETGLKSKLDAVTTTGSAYSETGDYAKWAYEKDGDSYVRNVGDTTIVESTDSSSGITTYTVYMITKTFYRDEYSTKNVRHILTFLDSYSESEGLTDEQAKAKADEILAEYNNGDKTEEAFAALAEKYSMDKGTKDKGGLYENALKGETADEFDAWIYDDSRKAGDVGIIKTKFGYHVMYYIGDGRTAWMVSAESNQRSADYTSAYAELEKKYTTSTDDSAMNALSVATIG